MARRATTRGSMGASRNWDTSGASTASEFSIGSEGVAVGVISAGKDEVGSPVDSVEAGSGWSKGSEALVIGVVVLDMVVGMKVVKLECD
jgi:hypothetical protein